MPVYQVRAPNGKIYSVNAPANAREEDLFAYVKQQMTMDSLLPPAPKEQAGFWGAFKDSISTLGLADEAAMFAANPSEENREAFLDAAESKYKSVGGFGKGENWENFKELLGSSLGALVAPLVGGVAGAAAGPLGGIAGFTGTSAAQYNIQNLRRQAEEQQAAAEEGLPVPELSLGKAAAASLAQAGLDVVPGALILKGLNKFPVAQRLLAKDKTSNEAAQVLIDAFNKGNLSLKGNVAKGVGLGVAFEVPQEIAQQALERWQAGLSLTDDEAKEEFKQAAIGAAILGGGFGAIGGYATYRGEQAARAQEQADIEASMFGAPAEGGIPADLYAQDEARRVQEQADIARSLVTPPVEGGIPFDMFESEADREARLEREAIQEIEREEAAARQQLQRGPYSARTLREAAEAEALAPREEDEGVPYFPPKEDEGDELFGKIDEEKLRKLKIRQANKGVLEGYGPTESGIPYGMLYDYFDPEIQQIKEQTRRLRALNEEQEALYGDMWRSSPYLGQFETEDAQIEAQRQANLEQLQQMEAGYTPSFEAPTAAPASTEGVLEGLGAPTEGGIPADMLAPTVRELALEVIKVSPTIKAVAQATGLNQPRAAALMRQFVDEGILERKGNKFVLAAPEAIDVSGAPSVDTETDRRSDRRSPELFTLESPTGELGAVPTRPAGLDTAGDVTERVDEREGTVPPALEAEGALEGLGAPTEGGIPAEYFAERQKVRDLKNRALDFIRQTGKGNAPDLQKALDISLTEAKTLRKALLGSGAVVQGTNVRATKTTQGSYRVVEGDYVPSGRFVPRETAVTETRQEPAAETGFEEFGFEEAPTETGLPPQMLENYFTEQRLEEARQRATGRLRGEGVESETERIQREADKAAEFAPAPKLRPTFRGVPKEELAEDVRRVFANLEAEGNAQKIAKLDEAIARAERQSVNKKLTKEERAEQNRLANTLKSERQQAVSQQGFDLVGGKGRPTLSDVEKRILADIKSAAEFLVQTGKMSVDEVDKFNQELRKPAPDVRKLRKMVDNISSKEEGFESEEQQDLDESSFIISENFKDDVGRSKVLSEEREEVEEARPRAGRPLNLNEQILFFRKGAINRFKKRKSQVKGMRLETVRNLIGRITTGWKNPPNFIVVQSYLDLPEGLNVESNADNMGLASGNDVYIIADNIRLLSDLKAVVFHESLGHYGLEQLFGKRLLQTMLDIYRTNNRMQADADAWLAENPDTYPESEYTLDERRALATEEVFAEMSESGQIMRDPKMRSAFNRVAALIRKFARALSQLVGRDLAYTNAEINDIIAQAHNKVITGKTRVVPRYNNIRYMKSTYNKVLTDALRKVQSGAPGATQNVLTGVVNSLDNIPEPMRNFKLSTFSLHHMMQLYERYAPSIRRLNILVERMAKDATDTLVNHEKKTFGYRKVLRDNPNSIDAFNDVANFINISQAPVLEEQLNANGEFVRFVPNVAAQQLRNVPMGSAAYNALTPEEKVLHQAVNQFYALPADMQRAVADIYTDYRKYSDQAFKVKLEQFLTRLPPVTVAAIKKKYQDNRLKFYLPLRREGTYKLVYQNPDATKVSKLLVSEAERNLEKEKALANGATILDDKTVIGNKSYESSNSAPTGLLKELGDNIESALRAANASQDTIEETKRVIFDTFVDYMPATSGNDLRQEINSRVTWVMNGYTFTGRLGAIEDVVGVYEKAVPRMIYQINNLKYTMPLEKTREKINEQFAKYNADKNTDPKFAGLPNIDPDYVENVKSDLDKRIKFAKNPIYSNYVYALSKANYIYSIALNISSALINTTILPMMAWPSLAAKYGIADATKAVGQAMAMFFRNSYRDPATGRLQFNINPTFGNGASGEFAQLHRMLEARSVTGTSAEQELQQAQNITVPGYEGLSAKVNLAMSYVFRSSERFNREVTAIAAYMLARNIDANGQRLNPNRGQASARKATEEAIRLNYDVNGATLPETNSRLYQNDIGRIILTFRTHALNMILNLAFTFNQAIETINANQPNATQRKLLRSIAQKKLLYIFGSTYMLAGIKGLPLFGAAEVLASLIMGDDDEPYDLEQMVLDSVGTLGLNGPINELLNVDIASRTGFYGLLWRDDPKRLAEVGIPVYVLERIAGPTYGLVEAARRGFNDLADGELVRASEALTPAPIRNMIKGMRYGIEGAQTRDGLPIVEDVSAYNSAMQILGFAPADLATAQAQRGATYQVSEKLKNRRVALLTNLYAARKADNAEAMQKALEDIQKFNASNPSYRITGDTINKSYNERERRAREAIMGVYQPRSLRIATSEYVTDLDERDGL